MSNFVSCKLVECTHCIVYLTGTKYLLGNEKRKN